MSYKKGGIGEITKAKIDAFFFKKKILPTPTGYFIEVLKNEKSWDILDFSLKIACTFSPKF